MSDFLPPEILTQILSKLSVKSILRFRCVSKTWYSLISSPYFISDHSLNHSTGDRVLVHRRDTLNDTSKFTFHDESFVESDEHYDVPNLLRSSVVEIVGSCDGLICFCKRDHFHDEYDTYGGPLHTFLIWNPSVRKLVKLPSRYPPYSENVRYLSGFGFDSESSDHKVVRVAFHKTYGYPSNDVVAAKSDIFDLRKGVWRSSSSPMRPRDYKQPPVCLYGNLHWIGNGDPTFTTNYFLVSFSLSGEVLPEMGMVPGDGESDVCVGSYTKLFPINGLLSVAVVKKMRRGDDHKDYCSVWSMKEYGVTESWTKLFNVELPYTVNLLLLFRFWENGEVLLVERVVKYKRPRDSDGGDVLVLYNAESKKPMVLISTNNEHILSVCFYKESLVLL